MFVWSCTFLTWMADELDGKLPNVVFPKNLGKEVFYTYIANSEIKKIIYSQENLIYSSKIILSNGYCISFFTIQNLQVFIVAVLSVSIQAELQRIKYNFLKGNDVTILFKTQVP